MNGDGKDDIVGFKSPGVWVSLSVGDRFLPPSVWVDDYSADSSWGDFDDEPRMAGDLIGDGRAEFAGCASTGVVVYGHDTYLDFGYNADGIMASATISDTGGVTTTTYVGDHQEWVGADPTNYYFHNGRRVAMSVDGGDPIYMHADHLQSTSDTSGDTTSGSQYYYPYGGTRGGSEVATDYRYTGQRWQSALGLYYYRARWYDPQMRRFIQADTIVPEPGNPQTLNRYAYALNNPVKYNDPSGHWVPRTSTAVHEQVLWDPNLQEHFGFAFHSDNASTLRKLALAMTAKAMNARVRSEDGTTAADANIAVVRHSSRLAQGDVGVFVEQTGEVLSGYEGNFIQDIARILKRGNGAGEQSSLAEEIKGNEGFLIQFHDPGADPGSQTLHFWYYVEYSFEEGILPAAVANYGHEIKGPGSSWEDLWLGDKGIELGQLLYHAQQNGGLQTFDVEAWLAENIFE